MADDKDCRKLKELSDEINRIKELIEKTRNEADELGFGTAQLMRMIVASTELAKAMDALKDATWPVFVRWLKDEPDALKDLDVDQIKAILGVLLAQAKLIRDSAKKEDERKYPGLKAWIAKLEGILANWKDDQNQGDARKLLEDAFQQLKNLKIGRSSWLLEQLKKVFTDDLLKAAGEELAKRRKELYKQIAYRIVALAVGKSAAEKFNKWIGVALTSWELIVELAASDQISDLRAHIDKLLLERTKLLVACGYIWPERGNAYDFPGAKWLGKKITMRCYVRCGKMVDGKIVWGTPCQVRYARNGNPLSLSFTVGEEHRMPGTNRFRIPDTGILKADADKCSQGNSFCYVYDVVEYTGDDGQPVTLHITRGALVK